MSRKNQSVTLSLNNHEKSQLEKLATEFGCEWGDRPNISKLIKQIAKRELKIAPNNDWQLERINALERIHTFLIDRGQIDEAIALAQILNERGELKDIALKREIAKFLQQPLPTWRQRIDSFIRRQKPFQLSYQDAQERIWSFSIHHAQIVTHEKRQYLDCWATETEGNLDLPELQHNWSLRLDRIQDAAVSPLNEKWRSHLDSISVELHLYRGLAFAYQGKSTDVHNDWHPELPKTRQVICQVTSTFWFFREILPYGKDCKIIAPQSISDLFKQDLEALYQMYNPKH